MADERKLRLDALAAVEKANWKKAAECYVELEKIEPADGMWAQKVGEMLRKVGRPQDAIAAFGRAADRYAAKGALVKAIAVCKLILEVDPKHVETLESWPRCTGRSRICQP